MFRVLLRLVVCAVAVFGFCAFDWVQNHIRADSEFQKYARILDGKEGDRIKAQVLERLPLGSNFDAVKAFCAKHFTEEVRKSPASAGEKASLKKPYVYIDAYSLWRVPSSGAFLTFTFVLDKDDRLDDVVVYCGSASM